MGAIFLAFVVNTDTNYYMSSKWHIGTQAQLLNNLLIEL